MTFEKNSEYSIISPLSACSGCSNNGSQVYNGHYGDQRKTARECSSSPNS